MVTTGVSRLGPVVRRKADDQTGSGSVPLRLSFLFQSCDLWKSINDQSLLVISKEAVVNTWDV